MNGLKVHTVFVSSMRRTLQTAYELFKNHPDLPSIKFILTPTMKEGLKRTSDIPTNIDTTVEEFKDKLPNMDLSLFDCYKNKYNYFFEDLQESLRNELEPKIERKDDDPLGNNLYDLIFEKTKINHPHRTESLQNIYERAQRTKKIIRDYIEQNQIPKDEKVVLIGHYTFFMFCTGKWKGNEKYKSLDGTDNITTEPDEFIEFENVGIKALEL